MLRSLEEEGKRIEGFKKDLEKEETREQAQREKDLEKLYKELMAA